MILDLTLKNLVYFGFVSLFRVFFVRNCYIKQTFAQVQTIAVLKAAQLSLNPIKQEFPCFSKQIQQNYENSIIYTRIVAMRRK